MEEPGDQASQTNQGKQPKDISKVGCFVNILTFVDQSQRSPPVTTDSAKPEPAPAAAPEFDYSDTSKMACLLCQRQFKALEILRKHIAQSDLHKVCDPSLAWYRLNTTTEQS